MTTTEQLEVRRETQNNQDEHLKQCSNCGKHFIDNENDYVVDCNGDIYCEDCRDEHLSYCERCNEYSPSDDFVQIENLNEWWCSSCASNHAYHCENCGDWISENHGDNQTVLCSSCYNDYYSTCDSCCDVIHNDNAYFDDCGCYCESCYDERNSSEIRDYGYEPHLNFQKSPLHKNLYHSKVFYDSQLW